MIRISLALKSVYGKYYRIARVYDNLIYIYQMFRSDVLRSIYHFISLE